MSRFRETFKKPALDHLDRRHDRVTSLARNRKEKRGYSFAAQRNVIENIEDDPFDIEMNIDGKNEINVNLQNQDDPKKPKESVKQRLQKWKAEKEKQKLREHQLKEKSRQPFKVGVVHHSNKPLEIAPLHPVKSTVNAHVKSVVALNITKTSGLFNFQPFATYQSKAAAQQHGNKSGHSHTTRTLKEFATPQVQTFKGQHYQADASVKPTSSKGITSKKQSQSSESISAATQTRVTRASAQTSSNINANSQQNKKGSARRGNVQPSTTRTPGTRGNVQPTTRTPGTRGNVQPTTRTPGTRGNIQPTTRTPGTRGSIQPTTRMPGTRGSIQPTRRTPATRGSIQTTTRTPGSVQPATRTPGTQATNRTPATQGNIQPTTRTPSTRGNVQRPNQTPGTRGTAKQIARTPGTRGTRATRANIRTPGGRGTASNTDDQHTNSDINEELMVAISEQLRIEENASDNDSPVKSQNHTLNETFEIDSEETSSQTVDVTSALILSSDVSEVKATTPKRKSTRKQHEADMEIEIPAINVSSGENEEAHDCAYFRNILANTIDILEARCNVWEQEQQSSGDSMTEIAHEQLLLATGMARLLIREKFAQFRGLIDNCENPLNSETTTLCSDLQGFWDMIYIQVGDIDKKFKQLEILKKNNWVPVVQTTVAKVTRKKAAATSATKAKPAAPRGPSKFKEFMAARKNKETSEIPAVEEVQAKPEEQKVARPSLGARRSTTRNSITTPFKKIESPNVAAIWSASRIAKSAGRKSFTSDLNDSVRKRHSGTPLGSSPLLAKGSSPKISKANPSARATPIRSILKKEDPIASGTRKNVIFRASIPEETPEEEEETHVMPVSRTYSHQQYAVSPIKDKFDALFVSSPLVSRKPSLLYTPPNATPQNVQENVTPDYNLFDIPEEPPSKTRKPPTPYITKRKERKPRQTEELNVPMTDTTNLNSPSGRYTRNSTARLSSLKPPKGTPDLICWDSPNTTAQRRSSRLHKANP